ncbi:hypothetical protein BDV10DRAFT_176977 [Aspergillus recurvatus]
MQVEYPQATSPELLITSAPSLLYPYSSSPSSFFGQKLLPATPSTPRSGPPLKPIPPQTQTQRQTGRVKRPHTKSRRGCYNCKSRRIKCSEAKPACGNCIYKELECVYPPPPEADTHTQTVIQNQRTSASSSSPGDGLSSFPSASLLSARISPAPFTGDDLRFWHHFLIDARPHLPFGDEGTWLSTIPAFAHDCPPLLHSILSLGASHCALIAPNNHGLQYHKLAISHRGRALQALSGILSKGASCTVLEMDGALATCYTLTFQAHHMADGVTDFAVMVRGCGLVTDWYFEQRRESTIFDLKSQTEMAEMITGWLPVEMNPVHEPETVKACMRSLERLQVRLESPAHVSFYISLMTAYEALLLSHRHAFMALVAIYARWKEMDNGQFMAFVKPDNHISRALFMHFVTIDTFMKPVYFKLTRERNIASSGGYFLIYRWVEDVYTGLPREMREWVRDLVGYIAVDLLPEVERHRRQFPQWEHELERFIEWLGRQLSLDIKGTCDI